MKPHETMMRNRLLSLLLVMLLAAGLLAVLPVAGLAADAPAETPDRYVLDGVTYYNTKSQSFSSDKKFYEDLLISKNPELDQGSLAELWMQLAVGLGGEGRVLTIPDLLTFTSLGLERGSIKNKDTAVTVKVKQPGWTQSGDKGCIDEEITVTRGLERFIYTVSFSDFRIVAILPDADKPDSYISSIVSEGESTSEETYSLGARNETIEGSVNVSQALKDSYTATVSSTVNHSQSYAFEESVQYSTEFKFLGAKTGLSFGFKSTQSVSNGWSKSNTDSETRGVDHSTSVTLEPCTAVQLLTTKGSTTTVTKYNCAVALRYKVNIKITKTITPNDWFTKTSQLEFDFGPDARAELYQRAISEGAKNYDRQKIDWVSLRENGTINTAIQLIATHAPMSSTDASFTDTLDFTTTEIKDKLPLYPLHFLVLSAPNVSNISQQAIDYGIYRYLEQSMQVGDTSYTNYLKVDACNKLYAPYYGFSVKLGHWVVADENGAEMKADEAPVRLDKNAAYGQCRYTAVRPGICYLKYVINEDVYTSAENLSVYATNDSLKFTAALRITVTDPVTEATPVVSGSYTGMVNAEPDSIERENGLEVRCYDSTGKGVEASYIWESQDLPQWGIQLSEDGMVTFTKRGIYKVRARCGSHYSDWVEITAIAGGADDPETDPAEDVHVEAYADSRFEIQGNYVGVVGAKPESILEPYMDCSGLSVKVLDPTDRQIPVACTWEAKEKSGIRLTQEGLISFTKPGTYHVRARSGAYHSAWAKVTAYNHPRPQSLVGFSRNDTSEYSVGDLIQLFIPGKTIQACTSSNPKVASVDDTGFLQILKSGKTTVTVVTTDQKTLKLKVQAISAEKPETVTIAQGKQVTAIVGQQLALEANLNPETAWSALSWSTSNKKIAKVNQNGLVTPVSAGQAKITVETANGKTASIRVVVVEAMPEKVQIDQGAKAKLKAGKTLQLSTTVYPLNAGTDVSWKSSDQNVATVNRNGLVTAVAPGEATITVKTLAGGKKAVIRIIVK